MTVTVEAWYDEDAGPLVRLYARVGGRAAGIREDLELSTIICRVPGEPLPEGLSADQHEALRLTRRPVSLSEIAAHLGLPLGPTRRLLGPLRGAGLITVRRSSGEDESGYPAVLQRILSGLRAL
jgi:hypothetical protein